MHRTNFSPGTMFTFLPHLEPMHTGYILIRTVLISGQHAAIAFFAECYVVSFMYSSTGMVCQSMISSDSKSSVFEYCVIVNFNPLYCFVVTCEIDHLATLPDLPT